MIDCLVIISINFIAFGYTFGMIDEMDRLHYHYLKSPYGELILGDFKDQLVLCDWRYRKMRSKVDQRIKSLTSAIWIEKISPIIERTVCQLTEYFEGKRTQFDLPLYLVGTDFQKRVWQELMQIEYGKSSTYLELTKRLGDVKAIRAVAAANGANAISIIIPCHRIIGSNGNLVGYAGGMSAKEGLLKLEHSDFFDKFPRQLELNF